MQQPGEPSVEEILESIKKVIARDNRASAAEQRRQRETDGVAEADSPVVAFEVAEESDDDDADVLDLAEVLDDGSDEEPAASEAAPLITENARVSMRESLTALAMLAEPGKPPQIVRSGETSLEGLVRDLLRPARADWLDKNLPPLVERMVAAEIARIVGKKV